MEYKVYSFLEGHITIIKLHLILDSRYVVAYIALHNSFEYVMCYVVNIILFWFWDSQFMGALILWIVTFSPSNYKLS